MYPIDAIKVRRPLRRPFPLSPLAWRACASVANEQLPRRLGCRSSTPPPPPSTTA